MVFFFFQFDKDKFWEFIKQSTPLTSKPQTHTKRRNIGERQLQKDRKIRFSFGVGKDICT